MYICLHKEMAVYININIQIIYVYKYSLNYKNLWNSL